MAEPVDPSTAGVAGGYARGQDPRSIASQWKPGKSANPGGMVRGFEKPSSLLRRYGTLSREELLALDDATLTCAQLRARATIIDGLDLADASVRLKFIQAADDRVEGKPHQAAEVRLVDVADPTTPNDTPTGKAMAAAELLRACGLDVPAELQALIERGEPDE